MADDPQHNLTLSKNDFVFIRTKRGWEERKSITLSGEFMYPGTYILIEGETLGSVIRRSGGFKAGAFLPASIYIRKSAKEMERKRIDDYINQLENDITKITGEMISRGSSGAELQTLLTQQRSSLEKLKAIQPIGRVVIDFTNPKAFEDVAIEDCDTLYIPQRKSTVSVIGEVFNPSTFVLDKKKLNARFYIENSGGYKEEANQSDTYIIKANGSVVTRNMTSIHGYKLEAGDAIVVPRKIPKVSNTFKVFMETLSSITTITQNSLLIATSIQAFKEKASP
ncbi:MAG: hypothetical protein JW795_09750, partial [Chitinivibrionales bacterium]|nr:hypothetical protein [Chitinivibrionales bacterium]